MGWWKQEDHEFKVNLSYFGHLESAWDTLDLISKVLKQKVESVCSISCGSSAGAGHLLFKSPSGQLSMGTG